MYNPRVVTCAWLAQSDSREGRTAATAGWLRTSAEGWLEVKWSGPSRILGERWEERGVWGGAAALGWRLQWAWGGSQQLAASLALLRFCCQGMAPIRGNLAHSHFFSNAKLRSHFFSTHFVFPTFEVFYWPWSTFSTKWFSSLGINWRKRWRKRVLQLQTHSLLVFNVDWICLNWKPQLFISFETGKILKSQKFQIVEKKSAYNFLF